MLLPLLAALSSSAQAQQLETLMPVLNDLGMIIAKVESDGYQITDMTVGIAFEGGEGHSVPIEVNQDDPLLFVGMGDESHIMDLDLHVYDDKGNLISQDEMPDNMPVVAFEAPRSGLYSARVSVAQTQEGYLGGFFVLVTSYPSVFEPITINSTYMVMRTAVELLEEEQFQVLHGEWETVGEGQVHRIVLPVPPSGPCRAVAVASPERAKKLDLRVKDPQGNAVSEDRRNGEFAIVEFMPTVPGEWIFEVEARKLKRKMSDTHAMLVLACKNVG